MWLAATHFYLHHIWHMMLQVMSFLFSLFWYRLVSVINLFTERGMLFLANFNQTFLFLSVTNGLLSSLWSLCVCLWVNRNGCNSQIVKATLLANPEVKKIYYSVRTHKPAVGPFTFDIRALGPALYLYRWIQITLMNSWNHNGLTCICSFVIWWTIWKMPIN